MAVFRSSSFPDLEVIMITSRMLLFNFFFDLPILLLPPSSFHRESSAVEGKKFLCVCVAGRVVVVVVEERGDE